MDIPIRRIDTEIPLPEYKTPGAAAMDCAVREDVIIPSRGIGYASLNVSVKPPKNHFVLMVARSSLHKRGLMFANGIGILDQDYSGDGDEYKVILYNFTDASVEIKRGERISQIIVMPYEKVNWQELASLGTSDRGGIGSTGI